MKKFRYEKNGYNREDVNEFVLYVIHEMEKLIDRVSTQKDEINSLRQQLSNYSLEDTMIEKGKIIDNAKEYASRIVNSALKEANNMELEKNNFEEKKNSFKQELEEIILKQQSILEDINQESSDKQ